MASPTLACADVEASDAPTPYRQSTTTSTVYEAGAVHASPSRAVTTDPVTSAIRRPDRAGHRIGRDGSAGARVHRARLVHGARRRALPVRGGRVTRLDIGTGERRRRHRPQGRTGAGQLPDGRRHRPD